MEIKAGKRGESPAVLRDLGNPAGGCRATDPDGVRRHADGQSLGKLPRSFIHRMKPKFALLTALVAGLLPVAAIAQALPAAPQQAAPAASSDSAAPAPVPSTSASPAGQAPVFAPPSAFPARVALIMFTEAVYDTNEGQQAVAELQKKYQPQKDKLDALATEIDTLKKQMQAAPATLSDVERAARMKTIDTKDKQYQRDGDDAQTSYQTDLNEALGKVAQKFEVVMKKYVSDNGYTLLINAGDQSSPVMWASNQPNADITMAVIDVYNKSSGVAPPTPSAPSAATRARPAGTTTPRSAAPAKPATSTTTPKPPAK
jgi:outer membrane protein